MVEIHIKRIISGKTYNTDTATKICVIGHSGYKWLKENMNNDVITTRSSTYWPDFDSQLTELYQTRSGAFFVAGDGGACSIWRFLNRRQEPMEGEGIIPLSREETMKILELEGKTYELEEINGDFPEAGDETATFSLRLPPHLKIKVTKQAEREGLSLNAMLIRCIERCCASATAD